jgi:hypothetical protein
MRSLLVALLAGPLLTGCFINAKIPFDTDLNRTELGSKTGEATVHSVLWLVMWGDAGTQAAAKNGGITTITHMDQKIFTILFGVYASETVIVYGD